MTFCDENEHGNGWYEEKTHILYNKGLRNKLVEHDFAKKKVFTLLVFVLRGKTCENLCKCKTAATEVRKNDIFSRFYWLKTNKPDVFLGFSKHRFTHTLFLIPSLCLQHPREIKLFFLLFRAKEGAKSLALVTYCFTHPNLWTFRSSDDKPSGFFFLQVEWWRSARWRWSQGSFLLQKVLFGCGSCKNAVPPTQLECHACSLFQEGGRGGGGGEEEPQGGVCSYYCKRKDEAPFNPSPLTHLFFFFFVLMVGNDQWRSIRDVWSSATGRKHHGGRCELEEWGLGEVKGQRKKGGTFSEDGRFGGGVKGKEGTMTPMFKRLFSAPWHLTGSMESGLPPSPPQAWGETFLQNTIIII